MIGSLVVAVLVVVLGLVVARNSVRLIQQGNVGVVKRLGQFRAVHGPGVVFLLPFVDQLSRIDTRETPRTGDRQEVITRDNVAVTVNATIFSQVVDPQAALFNVSDYQVAIDQQARTTLRNAFGNVTLDQALSEREQLNASMQLQMESVTDKWGIRINRIEIVDITPPAPVLQALALQKQADQEKRAAVLQSEGQQQAAINVAEGQRQAMVKSAQADREASVLRAEGAKQAAILEAEAKAVAISTVYSAIKNQSPDQALIAILQLETLAKVATSQNSKLVVPVEAAGLLGAAQVLKDALSAPNQDGKVSRTS